MARKVPDKPARPNWYAVAPVIVYGQDPSRPPEPVRSSCVCDPASVNLTVIVAPAANATSEVRPVPVVGLITRPCPGNAPGGVNISVVLVSVNNDPNGIVTVPLSVSTNSFVVSGLMSRSNDVGIVGLFSISATPLTASQSLFTWAISISPSSGSANSNFLVVPLYFRNLPSIILGRSTSSR